MNKIKIVIRRLINFLPDKWAIQILYFIHLGKFVNWNNPKTFNEKLQWLKLYNRKPEYITMVDKYAVKDYVAGIIGDKYIIPTLGVWDKPEDIEWDSLPNLFVLKTTHGGGNFGVIIVKDKAKIDKKEIIKKLYIALSQDSFNYSREWPYKGVRKRIIAEKFIAPDSSKSKSDLPDYKFFCFNGEPKYCQVIRDRSSQEPIDFYDMNWAHQPFVGLNPMAEMGKSYVERPVNLASMIEICRRLSAGIPFVRVDLYEVKENDFFGELTFLPASGFGHFTPDEWNYKIGEYLNLPEKSLQIGGGKYYITEPSLHEIREDADLKDYKFFCFGGKVKCFKVDFDRQVEHRANYYTREGDLLKFGEIVCPPVYEKAIELPANLNEMIIIAEKLSKGHPFLRVDLYNISNRIFFGETTFFPASGLGKFTNDKWDFILGEWLQLPVNQV